jgi:hypothetical protein
MQNHHHLSNEGGFPVVFHPRLSPLSPSSFKSFPPLLFENWSLASDMEKVEVFLGKNPHFADVWLRGSDGRLVPAVRILLAIESPVLKEILEGNMEEDRTVPLSYPSVALQGIVSYTLTGKLIISDALDLMPLIDAANHFRLDTLANLAGTTLRDIQFDNYRCCFALVFSSGNLTVKEVKLIMLCTSKALSSALAKEIPDRWYDLICRAPPEEDSSILDLLQAVQQSDVNGWITYDEKTFSGKPSRMLIPAFKGRIPREFDQLRHYWENQGEKYFNSQSMTAKQYARNFIADHKDKQFFLVRKSDYSRSFMAKHMTDEHEIVEKIKQNIESRNKKLKLKRKLEQSRPGEECSTFQEAPLLAAAEVRLTESPNKRASLDSYATQGDMHFSPSIAPICDGLALENEPWGAEWGEFDLDLGQIDADVVALLSEEDNTVGSVDNVRI